MRDIRSRLFLPHFALPYAPCPMPSALCPMPYTLGPQSRTVERIFNLKSNI